VTDIPFGKISMILKPQIPEHCVVMALLRPVWCQGGFTM